MPNDTGLQGGRDSLNLASDKVVDQTADEDRVMRAFLSGVPVDAEIAQRVQERSRHIREAIFRKHGLVDIAVPAIRELRGPLPGARLPV